MSNFNIFLSGGRVRVVADRGAAAAGQDVVPDEEGKDRVDKDGARAAQRALQEPQFGLQVVASDGPSLHINFHSEYQTFCLMHKYLPN